MRTTAIKTEAKLYFGMKILSKRLLETHIVLIIVRASSAQCGTSQTTKGSYATGRPMASTQIDLLSSTGDASLCHPHSGTAVHFYFCP